ncbi:MAG: cadherin-like beta sandwich domain-containing protein, partial [Chloroflexi bacterium]|nr:cadherin-like beta sandwich domain-containing protein [Chloroflexota bacterium]
MNQPSARVLIFTLFTSLLIQTILFSTVGGASANPTPKIGPDPLRQNDGTAEQVAPEQDASLSDLDVTVNGASVTLDPTFDPDTTHYTATDNSERVFFTGSVTQPGAGIDQTTVGDETLNWNPPGTILATSADLTEGAIVAASLRVLASDGVTTKTYHLFLSRPADQAVPDITMAANTAEYTAGLGEVFFTLTREGDTADSLDVTVNITQERAWLSDTAHTATFAAGDAETSLILPASRFSSSVTRSGELTATVAPITGYDTSGAIVQIRVISQEGPAVTVQIEHSEYTFDEDA